MWAPAEDDIARIYFGETSQSVVHIPPKRVASATYTILDRSRGEDDSNQIIGTEDAAATLDSYDQTSSAAAGPSQADPRKITISTSGITVGNIYEFTDANADGFSTLVRVTSTGSGYVKVASRLPTDFATSATLKGVQFSASFPDATAADTDFIDEDRPLMVRWKYTIDGRPFVYDQQVRIERRGQADAEYARVESWIREAWEDLMVEMPENAQTLMSWIRYSDRRIRSRMNARGDKPEDFFGGPQYQDLLMLRTILHMADQGLTPKNRDIERFREERKQDYIAAWGALFAGSSGKNTVEVTRDNDQATRNHGTRYRHAFGVS